MMVEPGKDSRQIPAPFHGIYYPALPHHYKRRYPTYAEATCQTGILFGIELCYHRPAGQNCCQFLHHRCKVTAVRSPGGPEFGQHRSWIPLDQTVKISLGHCYRMRVENRQCSFATAAKPLHPFPEERNPVDHATTFAGDEIVIFLA